MSLIAFDIGFLILCLAALALAIYLKRDKFKRQGLIYLYPTQLGVKFIDRTAKKFPKTLHFLKYLVISWGYVLLIGGVWMILASVYLYIRSPVISQVIKAPPIFPVIPYFTNFFQLDSFFPPFYFIYFLCAIAIVAVVHEYAHGIFARLYKIKIHSTGFAFLGPFLGAYVEPDEKQTDKSPKVAQLSIQASGVFANTVAALIAGALLLLLFSLSFSPSGVNIINGYPTALTTTESVLPFVNSTSLNSGELIPVIINNSTYYLHPAFINASLINNLNYTQVYLNSPALKAQLTGPPDPSQAYGISVAIKKIDGKKITTQEELFSTLSSHKPGEEITVKTITTKSRILSTLHPIYSGEEKTYKLKLGNNNGTALLGIRVVPGSSSDGKLAHLMSYLFFSPIKDLSIYYESNIGEFGIFLYYLLWWIAILNVFVALFNMLPLGPLDGGKFLLLTVWGITKNKKTGEIAFSIATWVLLAALILMMLKWAFGLF